MKKGVNILDRLRVSHMAQLQNLLDFPPAPKLNALGRLDPTKASQSELRGETVFFGKGQCVSCHVPPFYLDDKMHDLKVERFLTEPADGPIKTSLCAALRTALLTSTMDVCSRWRIRSSSSILFWA